MCSRSPKRPSAWLRSDLTAHYFRGSPATAARSPLFAMPLFGSLSLAYNGGGSVGQYVAGKEDIDACGSGLFILRAGAKQVRLAASVDTGSSFRVFGAEVAEALGLTLERGSHMRFRTANSGFEAFGHEVEIRVLGVDTNSMFYFFADPMIDKNVLGRVGWLDRVRLGLVHHDSKVYLAPYDQG